MLLVCCYYFMQAFKTIQRFPPTVCRFRTLYPRPDIVIRAICDVVFIKVHLVYVHKKLSPKASLIIILCLRPSKNVTLLTGGPEWSFACVISNLSVVFEPNSRLHSPQKRVSTKALRYSYPKWLFWCTSLRKWCNQKSNHSLFHHLVRTCQSNRLVWWQDN